ncbi:zinc finger protein 260-like [Palaemon carinicauda]|uniref:zinc finger protein 260-like n=1 Tax=Palaemon carinicauda TaxID=392227 RepID=UPI0035B5CBB6
MDLPHKNDNMPMANVSEYDSHKNLYKKAKYSHLPESLLKEKDFTMEQEKNGEYSRTEGVDQDFVAVKKNTKGESVILREVSQNFNSKSSSCESVMATSLSNVNGTAAHKNNSPPGLHGSEGIIKGCSEVDTGFQKDIVVEGRIFDDCQCFNLEDTGRSEREQYNCKQCAEVFLLRRDYIEHVLKCHTTEEKGLCSVCNKPLSKKFSSGDYKKISNLNQTSRDSDTHDNHLASHSEDKIFSCDECGKKCPSKFGCKNCGKNSNGDSALYVNEQIITDSQSYKNDSEKSLTTSSNLDAHQEVQSEEKLYICNVCNHSFAKEEHLQSHMQTHVEGNFYRCDQCNKTFLQASSHRTHMKTHTENSNYECETCGELFTLKSTLQVHLMKHQKDKPYKCTLCEKCFSYPSTLKTHMKVHLEIKPSPTVGESGEIIQESPSHGHRNTKKKQHQCEVCSRVFSLKNTLIVHMRRHSGEKPFKCTICDKGFTQSSALKIHMRTHTGDKPYSCGVCGLKFTYNYALQKHALVHKEAVETEEEGSENDLEGNIFELGAYDEEDIAANKAQYESVKRKILQILERAKARPAIADEEEEGIINEEEESIINEEEESIINEEEESIMNEEEESIINEEEESIIKEEEESIIKEEEESIINDEEASRDTVCNESN